jgi:hypothetical protein
MEERFQLDFIGIGAPRSGTSWLTDAMRAHPEICIQNHPREEIKKVLCFLDTYTDIDLETSRIYRNSAQKVKWKYLDNVLYSLSRILINIKGTYLLHILRKAGIPALFKNLNAVRYKYPEMNRRTRLHLYKVFKDDIKQLERLISRDLSHWE